MSNEHSIVLKLDANGVAAGIDQTTKSLKDLEIAEDKVTASSARLTKEQKQQYDLYKIGATAAAQAARETAAQAKELETLRSRLDPAYAATQRFAQSQEILTAARDKGNISLSEYNSLLGKSSNAMSNARGEFHQMISKMALLTSEITRVIFGVTAMAAAFAAPAIIGGKYLKDMEDLKLGITSVVLAMGTIDGKTLTWGQASQVADEQMKKLQNTAMFMAGTTQDLAKAFQAVATQGLEAGMSIDQIRTIAIAGVAAGRALGISATILQRDIRDMVLGIRPNSTILSASLGITKADIDRARESAGGLFEYLDGKLKGFIIASAQYNQTFTGMFEQMSEMFSRALSESSKDIFEGTKNSMKIIMDMIGSIDKKTGELTVNPQFKSMLDSILMILNSTLDVFISIGKEIASFSPLISSTLKIVAVAVEGISLILNGVVSGIITAALMISKLLKFDVSGAAALGRKWGDDFAAAAGESGKRMAAVMGLDDSTKLPLGNVSDQVKSIDSGLKELEGHIKAVGGAYIKASEDMDKFLALQSSSAHLQADMDKLKANRDKMAVGSEAYNNLSKEITKQEHAIELATKEVDYITRKRDMQIQIETLTGNEQKIAKINLDIYEKTNKVKAELATATGIKTALTANAPKDSVEAANRESAILRADKAIDQSKAQLHALEVQRKNEIIALNEKAESATDKWRKKLNEEAASIAGVAEEGHKLTKSETEYNDLIVALNSTKDKQLKNAGEELMAKAQLNIVNEASNIAMAEHAKNYKAVDEEAKKSIETIDKQIEKQKLHNEEIGKTPEQIALARAAFEEAGTRELETYRDNIAAAIQFAGIDADIYAVKVANLDKLINKRKDYSELEKTEAIIAKESAQINALAQNLQQTLSTVFLNGFNGTFSGIGEMFKQMLFKMAADAAAIDIANQFRSGGGANSWIKTILGMSGGSNNASLISQGDLSTSLGIPFPEARAIGGPVSANSPYIVGERGPELFVPRNSGTIVPNGQSGGITINDNTVINVDSRSDRARVLSDISKLIDGKQAMMLDKLQRQGRLA